MASGRVLAACGMVSLGLVVLAGRIHLAHPLGMEAATLVGPAFMVLAALALLVLDREEIPPRR